MARPLRIEYEHAYYHVTVRGNERRTIFRDDYDRDMFLDIVKAAYDRFGFIIHAFVLMDNHYHFLIETPEANLSASMRHINGVYTQAFNRRHKRVGHLFQGRYKAFVVDRDAYYLELIRYIHLNPWRAKMVRRLGDFKYSGHRAIMDKGWAARWKEWYDIGAVLKEFGRREKEAIRRYDEFVRAGKGMDNPLEKAIGGYALGNRDFADWLWKEFIEGKDTREITGVRQIRSRIDASSVMSEVSGEIGIKSSEVFARGCGRSGANPSRGMALYIMNRYSGMTQREIGKVAGDISRKAVSHAVLRFEQLMAHDERTGRLLNRCLKKLL